MKQDFSRSTARAAYGYSAVLVALAGISIAYGPEAGVSPPAADAVLIAPADAPTVTEARVCAAVAAYALSTGDHWDQRAAIAQAALNRFDHLGSVPDCGPSLTRLVGNRFDTRLWQASLDAVDAVQSGSYALPNACVRADTVRPLPRVTQRLPTLVATPAGAPPATSPAARTHCVIGDLAFFQGGAV